MALPEPRLSGRLLVIAGLLGAGAVALGWLVRYVVWRTVRRRRGRG
ncbi:hypothetical protein ACI8AA_18475 [Geodermatophilus sp. SYSU D01180]